MVFTLPMRNWNLYKAVNPYAVYLRFYATYEELKHVSKDSSCLKSFGFYATYEELKPAILIPMCRGKC